MLNLLAGADPMDPTSRSGETPDYTQALEAGVQGMVVGLPQEYLADGVDPRIADLVIQAARRFEDQGARVEEVSLFPREDALAAYSVILAAELSSNLARLDGVRYGHRSANAPDSFTMFAHTRGEAFGPGVKRSHSHGHLCPVSRTVPGLLSQSGSGSDSGREIIFPGLLAL